MGFAYESRTIDISGSVEDYLERWMESAMKNFTILAATVFTAFLVLAGFSGSATAGTIILEGSDAIGYHSNSVTGAATYRDQVWTAIGATDPRNIAVIGSGQGAIVSGSHAVSDFGSVAAAGTLSNYVALYFLAGAGCCMQDDSLITATGAQTAVAAYLTGGGTVMIQNYTGGSAWDFAVGAGGFGNANVAGVGGSLGGNSCSDGEAVTAVGLANGFTQPPAIGCWTHQAYRTSFFGPLGFTNSFFDAPSDIGGTGFSSLLAMGSTVTVTQSNVPEPASMAVLAFGTAAFGIARRRRLV